MDRIFDSGFPRTDAHSDLSGVEVLCSFFEFNADGKLKAVLENKHKFNNIESYIGTIKPPIYVNNLLIISGNLVKELEQHKIR